MFPARPESGKALCDNILSRSPIPRERTSYRNELVLVPENKGRNEPLASRQIQTILVNYLTANSVFAGFSTVSVPASIAAFWSFEM